MHFELNPLIHSHPFLLYFGCVIIIGGLAGWHLADLLEHRIGRATTVIVCFVFGYLFGSVGLLLWRYLA